MFINLNSPLGQITVNTYRNPNATVCELDDMLNAIHQMTDEQLVCDLEGAKDALEDGEYLGKIGASQVEVEVLHNAITEYEREAKRKA